MIWPPNDERKRSCGNGVIAFTRMNMKAQKLMCLASLFVLNCALQCIAQNTGSQPTAGPSLKETLDYINNRVNPNPPEAFTSHGHTHVTTSDDHREILVQQDSWEPNSSRPTDGRWYTSTSRLTVRSIDINRIITSSEGGDITLWCNSGLNCIDGERHSRSYDENISGKVTRAKGSFLVVFGFPQSTETLNRIARAFAHLIELLKAEQPPEAQDPFAK